MTSSVQRPAISFASATVGLVNRCTDTVSLVWGSLHDTLEESSNQ